MADDVAVALAIPLSAAATLDPRLFTGRILIDMMNFWPKLDSATEFAASPRDSSLLVARHFADSRVVKALNHLAFSDIAFDSRPEKEVHRRALAVASDNVEARESVMALVNLLGFDPVDAGALVNGRYFAPGTTIFNGGWRSATQIERILARYIT